MNQKYSDAVDHLDSNFAYFLTHVLNIGRPQESGVIPTACVAIEDKKKPDKFTFIFNPDFADSLNVEDYAFVLSHETMHILLNHLRLAPRFKDKVKFNLAADCVINDYLHAAGLDTSDDLESSIMAGEKLVGYDCSHATVGQVYDDIPDEYVEKYKAFQGIDDHEWIHVPDQYVKDLIDKMKEGGMTIPADLQKIANDINDKSDIKNMYAGKGQTAERKFMETHGVKMDWINLMKLIHPDIFKIREGKKMKPSFHNKPRKLGAFRDVFLPVKIESKKIGFGDKPVIFMALDTSGSIGDETARRFISLAKSIPQTEIHLEVVTFTDGVKELDLENPRFVSGGTAFSPIEEWIRNKCMPKYKNKYPKAVVVITDGCASFYNTKPTDEHKNRWFWLIEGGYSTSGLFGTVKKLKDYTN